VPVVAGLAAVVRLVRLVRPVAVGEVVGEAGAVPARVLVRATLSGASGTLSE
jgi:hypothetical protein